MEKEDIIIVVFLFILASGIIYTYQNLNSFECFMENTTSGVMSDVKYDFEPNGSSYGKSRVYRFEIISSRKRLEYFGMKILNNGDEVLFSQILTTPEGGSIVTTLLVNATDNITVDRFFKKKCYAEVRL
jgi:hypothetical protein